MVSCSANEYAISNLEDEYIIKNYVLLFELVALLLQFHM